MADFRSAAVTSTGTNVTNRPAELYAINIVNLHNAAIFVKFYNLVNPSFQNTPSLTLQIGANSTLNILEGRESLKSFPLGLSLRVVTGGTDNNNTAAATLPVIELKYRST